MAIPTWTPGQILTASDVNTWFVALNVTKGADQSIANNATPANDSVLVQALSANTKYTFTCVIIYSGGTLGAADLKFQFGIPTSATWKGIAAFVGTGGGGISGAYIDQTTSPASQAGTNGVGFKRAVHVQGVVTVAGTAGNFSFQWSQGTSNATATIVHADSYFSLWRIA